MFRFHSCVLWGRTKDNGPIKGRSCKRTRGIRQWCDAGVRLQGSEDVPMKWEKFRFWSLRSTITVRRQCFGKRTGEIRTDLGRAGQRCFQTVDNLCQFNHFDIRVNSGLVNWRQYKHFPAKAVAMAPKTKTKTDRRKCCREIGKWYNDVKYHKLHEMSSLVRRVCLALFFKALEYDSHKWWGRNCSLCARQWLRGGLLHKALHERQSLCDITWRLVCCTRHYTRGSVYVILPGD
jgi:hypothetical protein